MSGVRELLKHLKWVGENMLGGKEVRKKNEGEKNQNRNGETKQPLDVFASRLPQWIPE